MRMVGESRRGSLAAPQAGEPAWLGGLGEGRGGCRCPRSANLWCHQGEAEAGGMAGRAGAGGFLVLGQRGWGGEQS